MNKNTKAVFDETLNRCNSLVELFTQHGNHDLLRAAVVLAVAALDKYCKDKFLDFFESFYKRALSERQNHECCDAYLDMAGIKTADRLALYQDRSVDGTFNPEREIANRLQRYLYRSTFQSIESISELFKCYCLDDIIKHAVNKSDSPDVWRSVEALIYRRHQIAHTADCGTSDGVYGIDKDSVVGWLESLGELVECVDAIVDNRFKCGGEPRAMSDNLQLLSSMTESDFTAGHHRANGWLGVKEKSSLRRITDIEELFGVKVKRKGFLCPGGVDYPVLENAEIWWPKISAEPNYAKWVNKPQYDANGEIISIVEENVASEESNAKALANNIRNNRLRVVLAIVEGDSCVVGYCYRFLGTFLLDIEESKKLGACVWRRKDEKLKLNV